MEGGDFLKRSPAMRFKARERKEEGGGQSEVETGRETDGKLRLHRSIETTRVQ